MAADDREAFCFDNIPPGPLQARCIAGSNRVLLLCLKGAGWPICPRG
jgi:hypothetical protein